jgi:hypothetical protein
MRAPVTASEHDLLVPAGIVSEDRVDLPDGGGLPPSLLADLKDQIRCDEISFMGFDSQRQKTWFLQAIPDPDKPGLRKSIRCTGSTTGPASRAATPTGPATCATS